MYLVCGCRVRIDDNQRKITKWLIWCETATELREEMVRLGEAHGWFSRQCEEARKSWQPTSVRRSSGSGYAAMCFGRTPMPMKRPRRWRSGG